jgi:lysine 6-dehydrogenase
MKILLLGGAGIVGRAVIKDLVSQDDVSQVIVGDLELERVRKYIQMLNTNKVEVKTIDVTDHRALVELMKGCDVVGNSTYWKFCIPVSKAAIEAKVHVVDIGGMFYETQKQMGLDEEAKKANITMLSGCGSGPGINNVLARYGADNLDQVDEIVMYCGGSAPSPNGPPPKGPGMTIRTVLDEFTMKPVVWENGKFVEVPPLSGKEVVRFSEPIGEKTTYCSLHTELATLPIFIAGVKRVVLKVVFPEKEIAEIQPLIDMGLTRTDPILWEGKEVTPRQLLDAILVAKEQKMEDEGSQIAATLMTVSGVKAGIPTKLTYEYWVEQEKKWGNKKTGVPFAIGMLMLARGEFTQRGFAAPEHLNPVAFIDELKKREFVFKETKETTRSL